MAKLFIDGAAGTTGLGIRERLANRRDLTPITLDDAQRKDPRARREALNEADVVLLCLPDDAAREAVSLIENPNTRVIDASTAHRTAPGWTYGFPEMEKGQRAAIAKAKRVANVGCYATGFIALVRPLVRAGIIPADWPVTSNAVSGYSGGGKSMIAEFESETKTVACTYALTVDHKHVEEMRVHSLLSHRPLFEPTVARYYAGMIVDVPLQLWALPKKPKPADIHAALDEAYRGEAFVTVASAAEAAELKTLDAEMLTGTNKMKLFVFANEAQGQARAVAVLDNLGKGASGAAVQNLNIMTGAQETLGLA